MLSPRGTGVVSPLVVAALSSRIIERIFSGAVTRLKQGGKMSYTEFVAFLLSEEDKKTDKRSVVDDSFYIPIAILLLGRDSLDIFLVRLDKLFGFALPLSKVVSFIVGVQRRKACQDGLIS